MRPSLAPAALLAAALGAACAPPPSTDFSLASARRHVDALAGRLGSRPAGSEAHARARDYIVDELRRAGFDVRVQTADARRPEQGLSARVHNIVGVREGRRREAVALVSHYDSAPETPGAGDDAFGVAVCLEAARVLAARRDPVYSLMVLVTDAEENGLMGAAAAVADREVAERMAVFLNVDAIGATGPSLLFETGPGNAWLVGAWAAAAPRPRGASFAYEIYRRLPNDTDFTILKRTGAPGLNFAPIGESYVYHTARDTPARLADETLAQTGHNLVRIVEALDRRDITRRALQQATYFDLIGRRALAYGPVASAAIALVALAGGIAAWVRALRASLAAAGVWRLLLVAVLAAAGVVTAFGAMTGAVALLRATREAYHPWYAHPDRTFVFVALAGLAGGWIVARAAAFLLPPVARQPAVVWTLALPLWIAIAGAAAWSAPAAAFLWTLPLAAAGLVFALLPVGRPSLARLGSAAVLAAVAVLWLPSLVDVLHFSIAAAARQPIVVPVWLIPAILAGGALALVPPALAVVCGRSWRPAIAGSMLALALAAAAAWAWWAPAYTHDRPLRRVARYIQDTARPSAVWEVGGVEPGLDLGGNPLEWKPAQDAPHPLVRALRHPFVFRATGPASAALPAAARIRVVPEAAGASLTLSVAPLVRPLAVSFVLPAGIEPRRANLPGRVESGRWRATYIAMPPEGVALRASFEAGVASRLREARVVAIVAGLPGGEGWQRLPGWLPRERAVWSAQSWFVIEPVPEVAPPPVPRTIPTAGLPPAVPERPPSGAGARRAQRVAVQNADASAGAASPPR
jgi:hypothetical protein